MEEIEYKLNTGNSVLIVNAVDKLISTIKSKFKLTERQKFVIENEELKFLREKCSSEDSLISLTACQGLLTLVQLGVLEIGHTMSTVITLLPSAHNFSAIISTMGGLLTLDLKSRLVPGQPYVCQFSLRSPQHPFIMVLERNKGAEDDVIAQMHALCNHPDYIISSNALELLRPVFLWLTCECEGSAPRPRPWQLLLGLPASPARARLVRACLALQQTCNPKLSPRALAAYAAVAEADAPRAALAPLLARLARELLRHGRDPRECYSLVQRCSGEGGPPAPLALALLAEGLPATAAPHLHDLLNLGLNIISKLEYSSLSLSIFAALSLQWLHLPSFLTSAALKVAAKILDIYQDNQTEDTRLYMPNLLNNKIFQYLLPTDGHLSVMFRIHHIWERIRDNPDKLKSFIKDLSEVNNELKLELLPFFLGIMMEKRKEAWFDEVVIQVVDILIALVGVRKEVSVQVLPVLLYKVANDHSPLVKMACLKALPFMAKTKENVPTIVAVLNKLKVNKGVPTSFLIMLYTSLAQNQGPQQAEGSHDVIPKSDKVRCFPYLQEVLAEAGAGGAGRADDLKWETDIARAVAVRTICEIRPSTHGVELVSVISSILNKCTGAGGGAACCAALGALRALWAGAAVAPPGAWRALAHRLPRDTRPRVMVSVCQLLAEVPSLRVPTAEYDALIADAARQLWTYVSESHHPEVVEAACDALACYRIEDYRLRDIPEIYRRNVKLPASYCKTPADAARKPEDVLDYIPCEVWPEVFKYTNQAALPGVERLLTRIIEREIRGYRSGVYQPDVRVEPRDLAYLPAHSALRGLAEEFRRLATTALHSQSDEAACRAMLHALGAEYSKPLPPFDLCLLHELHHRGERWRRGCLTLASRQAHTSGSARRFLENFLQGITKETDIQESDKMMVFELLPILCRGMPPNTLRPPLEKFLNESYVEVTKHRVGDHKKGSTDDSEDKLLFIRQLELIEKCLECEKIHDANRTLISQIVENYFSVIPDDSVAWEAYVSACRHLSTKYLERLTSPSSWWEVTSESLRKACAVRCAAALLPACRRRLVWLNELIDAQATHLPEQEYTLSRMVAVLRAVDPDEESTREWLLQLMARTQVAFNETEEEWSKLYLCDVFTTSVVVLSGHWCLVPRPPHASYQTGAWEAARGARRETLPAAALALAARPAWAHCTAQIIEWLCHTRDVIKDGATSNMCQAALIALRHTEPFVKHAVWKRLESHFAISTMDGEE